MPLPLEQVHRIAAVEAGRAHRDLSVDTSRRIDPFAALETAGVLVFRRPLDRLAGAYLPATAVGGAPGVLINVGHPLSRQRYTAAHELCHHRRDRQTALDEDTEWLIRGGPDRHSDHERIAEAFASWFLMPRRLVDAALAALDVRPERLDPAGAYALALEFGTSYAATVHHLGNIRLLSSGQREQLLKVTPQTIKQQLEAIDAAADSRKNVWLIRPPHPPGTVSPQEGDAVVVEVPETPSSGYVWQTADLPEGLALVRDEYRGQEGQVLGGRGRHRFIFRVDTPGRSSLRLEMRRPWQPQTAADAYGLEVIAEPTPAPGIVQPRLLATGA
jgi:Zn-dependent peptidase ImmA (M78 family)/predicted secreted protein